MRGRFGPRVDAMPPAFPFDIKGFCFGRGLFLLGESTFGGRGRSGWGGERVRRGVGALGLSALGPFKRKGARAGGVAQSGFKASAFAKASASWEVGSNAEVCVLTTL